MRDFIPAAGVQPQRLAQAIRLPWCGTSTAGGDGDGSGVSCPRECVWEGFVLLRWGCGWGGGGGEVGAFEVGGCEGGDVVPD